MSLHSIPSVLTPTSFPWWYHKKDLLLKIAKREGTPLHVYDRKTIQDLSTMVKSTLKSVDRFHYAMKANNNPTILKLIRSQGIGFDTVSIGEIYNLFQNIDDIKANEILFTPNFVSRNDLEKAFQLGVNVTLDNKYMLEHWGSSLKNQKVWLRIDTDNPQGHHEFVQTAGKDSKFGIPIPEFKESLKLAREAGLKIVGLHAHVGSGVDKEKTWAKTLQTLSDLAELNPDIRTIDLGGGLKVKEDPIEGKEFDLRLVEKALHDTKKKMNPNIKVVMEPGRIFVASSGIMIGRVNQLKSKLDHHYVGIDVSMSHFLRPALYKATHQIVNLSKLESNHNSKSIVVGNVCETGDILNKSAMLPENTEEGDYLLMAATGAYGKSMSSRYNLLQRAKEIFI
ncbi:diaminopimelate decarboxylase 1 [Anaeramoeba flamelloides]|uniref:Diaminopimelate decarboxylase 1 n=1 Tax=Anaeramoeba flamelloides TaxID=1746091 RepID=A0AAV8A987_9EUKA|nr:diaminopimelate decarboxylase 1 -related [Anaeramoeba flamelloides]KAJ6253579.1 diaminopimelate decarboxylase 1 [Anaeramoeba flamelloides]|eukprot:Anaeramoba_flamelloidesa89986_113.p1 GENE.a89986_113~~a89986_113.p1  ORF type:complete len:395 (+),score=85.45 a89986_113:28-1212(+)